LAIRPLAWVRVLRRYVSVAVVLAVGYLLVALPTPATSPDVAGWDGFSAGVDTTLAVAVSWVPMAADYSRHSRSTRSAVLGAFGGYGVMQVLCYAVGLVAVGAVTSGDVFRAFLAVPFGVVAFLVLVSRELDQSFANVYSTTVSTQNLRPRWDRRVVSTVVGVLVTVLALGVQIDDYAGFLLLIGSVFVPMVGVLLADAACRRERWDLSTTAPARWAMLVPWALGFITYQLLNPGQVTGWADGWRRLDLAIGLVPPAWASASLFSFLVAAILTAATHLVVRRR
jgi:purine-cytosine permease-like protein